MALVSSSTVIKKQLYRHTFDLRRDDTGSVMIHTLLINPSDMSMEEPSRSTVTQTIGGAYVTDFGRGLPTVTLSGTTGYKRRASAEGGELDGFEEFMKFRQHIYRSFIQANDPNLSLNWYNWEDDEYYEIQPTHFRLQRSKSEPLLYRYELRFTCLRVLRNGRPIKEDFLQKYPQTIAIQQTMDSAISAVSEFILRVFGK